MAAVDFILKDSELISSPIDGVVVNVYDASSLLFITSTTSDASGRAAFLLPDGEYEVRFYKLAVNFKGPVRVQVAGEEPHLFDVLGDVDFLPATSGNHLCRCTGRFVDFRNRPVPNRLVRVTALSEVGSQRPKVVDGNMVEPGSMEFHTDVNGRVSFDLFRGGEYYVTLASEEDNPWPIKVPDRPAANLIDLIHPYPAVLDWSKNYIALEVEESVWVPFSILFSDFQRHTKELAKWVEISVDQEGLDVRFVSQTDARLEMTARAPGEYRVTAKLKTGDLPMRLPNYTLQYVPLVVTVS